MSKSIFDLNQVGIQSLNNGMNRMNYEQHTPTRDVTEDNFTKGQIHINWEVSGQKYWMPSKSYLRFRCSLTDAKGNQLTESDDIAPNYGLCSNLFQNGEFRINDKVVSRIGSFMPQIDALDTRLSKSKSWFESIGSSTNFWENKFSVRQADVTSDGTVVGDTDETILLTSKQLGFPEGTTVAFTAATKQFKFAAPAGGGIPDLETTFPIGSQFSFGSVNPKAFRVVDSDDDDNFIVVSGILIPSDIPATALIPFGKITPGKKGRNLKEFELIWQPPLSIFKVMHAMPSGKFSLVFTPNTSSIIQKYAIQSKTDDKIANLKSFESPTGESKFKFQILDMYLYLNTVEGPRFDNGSYYLDLNETTCSSKDITQNGISQKSFDVSPSTYALTACYQDNRVGNDTRCSSSKFKVNNTDYSLKAEELQLERFFMNFAGSNKPSPDASPNFKPNVDLTTQRYVDTMIYSSGYFDNGGCETIADFHENGSYYHFIWPRDGSDRSTRVVVNQQFNGTTKMDHFNLLLFSHAKKYCRVNIVDGRCVDVQIEDQ